MKITFVLQMTM